MAGGSSGVDYTLSSPSVWRLGIFACCCRPAMPRNTIRCELGGETRLDVRNPNTGPGGGFANPNPEILALPLAANGNVTPALQTALQAASQAPRKLPSTPPPLPTLGSFNPPERARLIITHRGFGIPKPALHHLLPSPSRLAEQSSPFSDCDCSHPYSLRWPRG